MPKVTITIEDSEEGNNIIKINTDFDAAEFIEKEGAENATSLMSPAQLASAVVMQFLTRTLEDESTTELNQHGEQSRDNGESTCGTEGCGCGN